MKNLQNLMKFSLIKLPSPTNISTLWNFGFMLGMVLIMQLISGVFLAMHYTPNTLMAFQSINHIIRDVNQGWLIQLSHMNGASLFFILIYIHIARGIYYSSYKKEYTWYTGFLILLMLMLSAFLGYVLPWGQMSFWGATVITNLLSAVPYFGDSIVTWLWGGFSVDNATLSRFFVFHFLFPFIIIVLAVFHLFFLHEKGSSNPLGTTSDSDKTPFYSYFFMKDTMCFMIILLLFYYVNMFSPLLLGDPENFNPANPMLTPIHIQPEWYFLFAYAILRSIPNKLGGVIALMMAIFVILLLSFMSKPYTSKSFSMFHKLVFWTWVTSFILLTFIGAKPVEDPFINIGQITSIFYFMLILNL